MIPSVRLPYRKITAAGFCFAAIVLRYGIALGQQPRRPCAEEVTKPLLEVALDTHLQETDPVRVRGAIQELGQKRCVEVIDDLVSVLTFRFPYPKDANEPGAGLQPPALAMPIAVDYPCPTMTLAYPGVANSMATLTPGRVVTSSIG